MEDDYSKTRSTVEVNKEIQDHRSQYFCPGFENHAARDEKPEEPNEERIDRRVSGIDEAPMLFDRVPRAKTQRFFRGRFGFTSQWRKSCIGNRRIRIYLESRFLRAIFIFLEEVGKVPWKLINIAQRGNNASASRQLQHLFGTPIFYQRAFY